MAWEMGKKIKMENSETIFLPVISLPTFPTVILLRLALLYILLFNVSCKWPSVTAGDLALMNAKRTHYFDSLNRNHNFQLESRNEKMKMYGLSQLLTFTCRYLLKNALNIHHQEKFYSFNTSALYRLLELLKQKIHCLFWNGSPQNTQGAYF